MARTVEETERLRRIADRLQARLDDLGWSQRDLARAVDTSAPIVCRILSGQRPPSLELAFRIQRSAVGLPADAWVTHSEADESGGYPIVADDTTPDLTRDTGS